MFINRFHHRYNRTHQESIDEHSNQKCEEGKRDNDEKEKEKELEDDTGAKDMEYSPGQNPYISDDGVPAAMRQNVRKIIEEDKSARKGMSDLKLASVQKELVLTP